MLAPLAGSAGRDTCRLGPAEFDTMPLPPYWRQALMSFAVYRQIHHWPGKPVSGLDAELFDLAGRDPQRAELLRRSLQRLQEGAGGPELQEMARDVLAGRIGLRVAAAYDCYQPALRAEFERYRQWHHDTSAAVKLASMAIQPVRMNDKSHRGPRIRVA